MLTADNLNKVPSVSGVYFFRDSHNSIIYVGKAVNLKNRISSYFQSKNRLDAKTLELVKNIEKIDYTQTQNEVEALILESEMIKRYKPKYNVDWKDDKNFIYIKITKEDYPQITTVRQIVDDRAKYIGPFVDATSLKGLLRYLRKVFMFRHCRKMPKRACLQYSIGNCSGPCQNHISKKEYNRNIRQIIKFFEGKTSKVKSEFRREMKKASFNEEFEKALSFKNKIEWLEKIEQLHLIKETDKVKKDKALNDLKTHLDLERFPKRIECFDISNIFGKAAVGSMVVFEDGIPLKSHYRRFEIKTVKKIDDFQMIQEVLQRRLNAVKQKNESFSKIPDLLIIDGGKGQVSVAKKVMDNFALEADVIGIAKREEEIFKFQDGFKKYSLPKKSEAMYLLQRIRDEAHRFAITYHRSKRGMEMTKSNLDIIEGVGPAKKKILLKKYGSVENIRKQSQSELEKALGKKLAKRVKENL